jgi:F420-0:gamma-glutamyl ligase
MGQADEGTPVVVVRGVPQMAGLPWGAGTGKARDLVRPREMDMFR